MSSAYLPVELLEQILSFCWAMPLRVDDRITLMTSSVSVSSVWRGVFLRVSSQDVHIPCPSFADHFLRILRQESFFLDTETRDLPNRLCRSLTIQIMYEKNDGDATGQELELPMEKAFSRLLYRFQDLSTPVIPNLGRITILYQDIGFDRIFENWTLIAFPPQATELELNYSFSSEMRRLLLCSKHKRQAYRPPWTTPSIRTLTVFGASRWLVWDMVSTCPNIENLITDLPSIILSRASQEST
ncbi:hypothetical protein C8R43DRAFT_433623 [Mycena crocata]|nr:hypothetical protein C8R43DRAFT_433623 [Mycena crocata]